MFEKIKSCPCVDLECVDLDWVGDFLKVPLFFIENHGQTFLVYSSL
jgi:hypothetical protein